MTGRWILSGTAIVTTANMARTLATADNHPESERRVYRYSAGRHEVEFWEYKEREVRHADH